jgi:probable rRNA maturation factor
MGRALHHAIVLQRASRLRGIPGNAQLKRWLVAALDDGGRPARVTLRLVNGTEGRALNRQYRGRDYATNVLTFVYHGQAAQVLEGDIVLCAPVVAREAREQGKSLRDHYAHLTIHGALHLCGMDHQNTREARAMETREAALLARWGIADPYRAGAKV